MFPTVLAADLFYLKVMQVDRKKDAMQQQIWAHLAI